MEKREKCFTLRNILTIFTFAFLSIVMLSTTSYAASSKMKVAKNLKENRQYSYDLDKNGRKEKISFKKKLITTNEEYGYKRAEYSIYINKKIAYTVPFTDISPDRNIEVQICDVNKKDKYLDIFVLSGWEKSTRGQILFLRYRNKKIRKIQDMTKIYNSKGYKDNIGGHALYSLTPIGIKTDGKNNLELPLCVRTTSVDSVHMFAKLKLKLGKFKDISRHTYNTYECGASNVKVKKAFRTYKEPASKKKSFIVKKGSKCLMQAVTFKNRKGYLKVKQGKKIGYISFTQLDYYDYFVWERIMHT